MKVLRAQQNRLTKAQIGRSIPAPALRSVVPSASTTAPRKAGFCMSGILCRRIPTNPVAAAVASLVRNQAPFASDAAMNTTVRGTRRMLMSGTRVTANGENPIPKQGEQVAELIESAIPIACGLGGLAMVKRIVQNSVSMRRDIVLRIVSFAVFQDASTPKRTVTRRMPTGTADAPASEAMEARIRLPSGDCFVSNTITFASDVGGASRILSSPLITLFLFLRAAKTQSRISSLCARGVTAQRPTTLLTIAPHPYSGNSDYGINRDADDCTRAMQRHTRRAA